MVAVAILIGPLLAQDAAAGKATRCQGHEHGEGSLVTARDGLLTVTACGEPLAAVLAEVGRESGIEVKIEGLLPSDPVEVSFAALPLEVAFRRVLGGKAGLVLVYRRSSSASSEASLAEAWIIGAGSGSGAAGGQVGGDGTRAEAADLVAGKGRAGAEDPDLKKRLVAIDVLAEGEASPAAIAALQAHLKDPRPLVQMAAAEGLGDLGDRSAIAALAELVASESNPRVREAGVEALGDLGSAEAIVAVRRALEDEDPSVRSTAVEILEEIGGGEAVDEWAARGESGPALSERR